MQLRFAARSSRRSRRSSRPALRRPSTGLDGAGRVRRPSVRRPSSSATLTIVSPTNGQSVAGPTVHVVIDLAGATIVSATTTDIRPDEGHIHLYVDNNLVSMNYGSTPGPGRAGRDPRPARRVRRRRPRPVQPARRHAGRRVHGDAMSRRGRSRRFVGARRRRDDRRGRARRRPVASPRILVGAVFPLSSNAAGLAGEELRGVQIAADLVNADGGVGGRRIELDVRDLASAGPGAGRDGLAQGRRRQHGHRRLLLGSLDRGQRRRGCRRARVLGGRRRGGPADRAGPAARLPRRRERDEPRDELRVVRRRAARAASRQGAGRPAGRDRQRPGRLRDLRRGRGGPDGDGGRCARRRAPLLQPRGARVRRT